MLVLFGANGRTGAALVAEAQRRGLPLRPIVRDDRDVMRIRKLVDVQTLSYADPTHLDAVRAVMHGATAIISAIDPRTQGPGHITYGPDATENIVRAGLEVGVERIQHVSVMGAFRWSYAEINQAAFDLEAGIRTLDAPWGIVRVSCYHDEVFDAHVRPPDGGRPHPLPKHCRWSPVSRKEAAGMILDQLAELVPGRLRVLGGPRSLHTHELERIIAPHRVKGGRALTKVLPLPPGDVSVDPDSTRAAVGYVATYDIEQALEEGNDDSEPAKRNTVYPSGDPPAHPADSGRGGAALARSGDDLRRVIHSQLVTDLPRVGVKGVGVRLDFSGASAGRRHVKAHGGELPELTGVRVLGPDDAVLYTGGVDILRDKLAEEFRCWWASESIPDRIWDELDMGVRRRLSRDPHFRDDPKVAAFLAQNGPQR